MSADGLLGPAEVRALAADLRLRPSKAQGQNFVIDPNTVRRIVRAADLDPDDLVVEVGPGLGSLTLGLLAAVRRVVAVEIDPVLAAALPATVAQRRPDLADRLEVITADALTLTDLPGHAHGAGRQPALQRRGAGPAHDARAVFPTCTGPWSWCRPRLRTASPRRRGHGPTACPR